MAYLTYTELVDHTGTKLSQTTLEGIISVADYEINSMLRASGISGGNSGDLKAASLKLSEIGVIRRHRMDGTMPRRMKIGGIEVEDDPDRAITDLRDEAHRIIREIIKSGRTYRNVMRVVNRC